MQITSLVICSMDKFDSKINEEFDDISVGTTVGERKIRKIVVDRVSCIGARSCVLVAPGAFQMDDGDLAYVPADVNAFEDDETVKLAAESCPVLAIHLYGRDGKKIFPRME
jgi:ferredoxin